MLHLIAGVSIFALTLVCIMVRPFHCTEAHAAAGGAILMLLAGLVRPSEAWGVISAQWNVYGFFLGLMTIAALADQAGFFEMLAHLAGRWGRGQAVRLYLAVFAIGALITTILSNDATALILTPVVFTLVTSLRLPVIPFMFACTFIADTASFILPVSNPINILVLNTSGIQLGTFLHYLLLPGLLCIVFNTAIFTLIYRRDLQKTYDPADVPAADLPNRHFYRYTVACLALIGLAYTIGSACQVPLCLVSLGGSVLLLAGAAYHHMLDWTRLRREISWSLFIFISGMFLVIYGIQNLGLTAAFGKLLLGLASAHSLHGILLLAGGTALGANLINNVPMALVMVSALDAMRTAGTVTQGMIYATVLGADLGPNLTTVGSLATMLWLFILRRKGLEISPLEYVKLGLIVVPPMILAASLMIWLAA